MRSLHALVDTRRDAAAARPMSIARRALLAAALACTLIAPLPTAAATLTDDAGQPGTLPNGGPNWLLASVLPSGRSVQVGVAATAFATIINTGPSTATTCGMALPAGLPATFAYQTTNSANQLIGRVNTPIDIPPGGIQRFMFAVTPTAPIGLVNVPLVFACANTSPAQPIVGLDTLLLSAYATPVPDIVAVAATTGNDGIVHVPPRGGAFAVAAANVGVGGVLTVTAEPNGNVPAVVTLCQTDLAGACRATPTSALTLTIGAGQILSFGLFVQPVGGYAFDPAMNRIFVLFRENDIVRGSTSVAPSPQ
jgi:hypothetical protein